MSGECAFISLGTLSSQRLTSSVIENIYLELGGRHGVGVDVHPLDHLELGHDRVRIL